MKSDALGKIIFQINNDEGSIVVYQQNNLRYLTFGNQIEQSCVNLCKPCRLEHAYSQAMLLSLLMSSTSDNVLLLGLGGGALLRALNCINSRMKIDAVEISPMVLAVAKEFFLLPESPSIQFHCDAAESYLKKTEKTFHHIYSDLYIEDQVHDSQLNLTFYQKCFDKLSNDGILIVNNWTGEFQKVKQSQQMLESVFKGKHLNLHIKGGNHITLAFKDQIPSINPKLFFNDAQLLGYQLDIPLQMHARNFWRQNAEILKIQKFK